MLSLQIHAQWSTGPPTLLKLRSLALRCPERLSLQITESSTAWLAGTYSFMTALEPQCFLWKVTEARSPVWKAATESSRHSVDLKIPCSASGTWSFVSRNTRCAIIRYYSAKTVNSRSLPWAVREDPTDRIPSFQREYPNPVCSCSDWQAASYSQHLGLILKHPHI